MMTSWGPLGFFERSKGRELRCFAAEDADDESLVILRVVELLRRTLALGDASRTSYFLLAGSPCLLDSPLGWGFGVGSE